MKTAYKSKAIESALLAYHGDPALQQNIALLFGLPDEERTPILRDVAALANSVPNMGATLAFEIICKIGQNAAKKVTP